MPSLLLGRTQRSAITERRKKKTEITTNAKVGKGKKEGKEKRRKREWEGGKKGAPPNQPFGYI